MNEKTKLYGKISLWAAVLILYAIAAWFQVLQYDWTAAIVNLAVTFVVALLISVLVAFATPQKEKVLVYAGTAFIVLILGEIVRVLVLYLINVARA